MAHDLLEVSFALGDELAALLDVGADLRKYELGIDFAIAFDKGVAQRSWYELAPRILHGDVGPLNDVGDVGWDRGICANGMLLHFLNE